MVCVCAFPNCENRMRKFKGLSLHELPYTEFGYSNNYRLLTLRIDGQWAPGLPVYFWYNKCIEDSPVDDIRKLLCAGDTSAVPGHFLTGLDEVPLLTAKAFFLNRHSHNTHRGTTKSLYYKCVPSELLLCSSLSPLHVF